GREDLLVWVGRGPLLALGSLPGEWPGPHVHSAQAPLAAREELGDHLLEASSGRLEGLLEGGRDLPVRAANQRPQLGDRLLEVLALLGELGDVLARLLVLALRQRVDRPDLLAVAV